MHWGDSLSKSGFDISLMFFQGSGIIATIVKYAGNFQFKLQYISFQELCIISLSVHSKHNRKIAIFNGSKIILISILVKSRQQFHLFEGIIKRKKPV